MFGLKYNSIIEALKIYKIFIPVPDATITDQFKIVTTRMDVVKHVILCTIFSFFGIYNFITPVQFFDSGSKILDNGLNVTYACGFFVTLAMKLMLSYYRGRLCKLAIFLHRCKCMTKMENFAGSRKVAHILKVWSLVSTKIHISSRSVENSSVMSHFPAAPLGLTNSAQFFFQSYNSLVLCLFDSLHRNLSEK
jgi:hypothetical protein